jgi:hypothetical protein
MNVGEECTLKIFSAHLIDGTITQNIPTVPFLCEGVIAGMEYGYVQVERDVRVSHMERARARSMTSLIRG